MPSKDDFKHGMDDLIRREGMGWKAISARSHQFVGTGGFGFCTQVDGDWNWEFHPSNSRHPQSNGKCRLVEAAKQAVQNCHSMSKDSSK